MTQVKAKFSLRRVVATLGAVSALEGAQESALGYLYRHAAGDWGNLGPYDCSVNERALRYGNRILSFYEAAGIQLYIITAWDRSVTTILLREEY